MKRTVAYLVNEHPLYLRMALHSLEMLVANLKSDVDLKMFLITDKSHTTIERNVTRPEWGYSPTPERLNQFRDLGVQVIVRPPADQFLHGNRQYLGELETDSLLYIDADTFIFGDVGKLFDDHAHQDFVAAEAEWVKARGFPHSMFNEPSGCPLKPFSSGVLLWNNGWHKDWAEKLPVWMERFRTREHPLGNWLYEQHPDCLLREEFSSTAWAHERLNDKNPIKHGYFDPKEVQLIRYSSDFDKLGKQTIFHCYTPNWWTCRQMLDGPKKKIPMMKVKR